MELRIVEVTNGAGRNHGKMLVARFDKEWERGRLVDEDPGLYSLLSTCGWGREHVLVFDLQTGEGALFRHGGLASADLTKHAVWVCPMFEPFLTWLYDQDVTDLSTLPELLDLPDAEFQFHGHRRPGPDYQDHVKRATDRIRAASFEAPQAGEWEARIAEILDDFAAHVTTPETGDTPA